MRNAFTRAALVLSLTLSAALPALADRRTLSCRDGTPGPVTLVAGRPLFECDADGAVDGRCVFSFPDFSRRPCRPLVDCPGPAFVSLPVGRRLGLPIKAGPFRLRCLPAEPPRPACGPQLHCDPSTDMCVSRQPVGPAIIYECKPVPSGCESNRTCACAGATLCQPPFDTCQDVARNEITCHCIECQ